MPFLRWDESPHWNSRDREPVIIEEPPIMELPRPLTPRTAKEISEGIQDDPRYNAMNPSNQQHIITMAIETARSSGTLIEDKEN